MTRKTLSFVKGKGSIRHNNRSFIADNVDQRRLPMNIYYKQQPLEEAYQQCFGEAIEEYNAKQTRADRKKGDYLTEIKNSGNGEKQFYETVVQIGKMDDTSVLGPDGVLTHDAAEAAKILMQYMETFQERNPNLYLFNAVLHMDEATPHLHLDYIPVATGYKTGLTKRNSLTKALQNMGFTKGRGKKDNETIDWQKREREYLTGLCRKRGIEIEVLGEDRPSLTLPEYKEAIHEAEELKNQNQILSQENKELSENNTELKEENEMLADEIQAAVLEAQAILDDMENEQADRQRKINQTIIEQKRQDLDASTKNAVNKEVAALVGEAESQAIDTTKGLFDSEPYVKVPKKLWKKMLQAYKWGVEKSKMVEKLTEQNVLLTEKAKENKQFKKKVMEFLTEHGLADIFQSFLKQKPGSIKAKMNRAISQTRSREVPNEEHKKNKTVSQHPEL